MFIETISAWAPPKSYFSPQPHAWKLEPVIEIYFSSQISPWIQITLGLNFRRLIQALNFSPQISPRANSPNSAYDAVRMSNIYAAFLFLFFLFYFYFYSFLFFRKKKHPSIFFFTYATWLKILHM